MDAVDSIAIVQRRLGVYVREIVVPPPHPHIE